MSLYSYVYNVEKKEYICLGKASHDDMKRLGDLMLGDWRCDTLVVFLEGSRIEWSRIESTLEDLELNGEVKDRDNSDHDQKELLYDDARKRDLRKEERESVLTVFENDDYFVEMPLSRIVGVVFQRVGCIDPDGKPCAPYFWAYQFLLDTGNPLLIESEVIAKRIYDAWKSRKYEDD